MGTRRLSASIAAGALVGVLLGFTPALPAINGKLPGPDLRGLLPLAAMPIEKPPIAIPSVALPPPPQTLPELPPPPYLIDRDQRPKVPMPLPRTLACNPMGSVFGVASELLECARARYQKGELDEARQTFQKAIQESSDRRLLREARYWLAETSLRLGKTADAERLFLLVQQEDPNSEFGPYAGNAAGWVILEQGNAARALPVFDAVLKLPAPPVVFAYARHGRAMSLYGLKRYADARDEWTRLLGPATVPPAGGSRALSTDATFWLGETLGRLGEYQDAVAQLKSFTAGNPTLFRDSGLLRLGWWSRAGGQPEEAVTAYRALLSSYPRSSDVPWARAGLVQALLDLGNYPAAHEEARQLEAADRGALSLPAWLIVRRWLADPLKPEEAAALDDDLLARTLPPPTRAWLLLVSADRLQRSDQADEARNRLGLVRQSPGVPAYGFQAGLRLAQLDFDVREYARAESAAKALLGETLPPDLRVPALLLAAESAYWARDYPEAASLYTRFLADAPKHELAPQVGLSLGWAEFRRGQLDAARQRWTTFAGAAPTDRRAAEVLLLSAELSAKAGDVATAQRLLGEVAMGSPNSEQGQLAILNRAILGVNAGRSAEALPELSLLVQRAPNSPYIGRVRLTRAVALLAAGRAPEAYPDLQVAVAQGEDALAHLGLGQLAFEQTKWDVAQREFTAARDAGSGAIASTAEYGLAATAFNQRQSDEFKRLATALLARPADARITPNLLYGQAVVAADEKRWPEARDQVLRLAGEFPRQPLAAPALSEVGSAAGADKQWQLAREMYEALAKRYPDHPGNAAGRLAYGEALLRTGAPSDARRELEAFTKSSPIDPQFPRALLLLAETQEALGNRAAAAELYARVDRDYPGARGDGTLPLKAARLLQTEGKWAEAKGMLERALSQSDPTAAPEVAYRLGEGLRATGQNEDAVEAYMTAAYLGPDSVWGRRALLGAGQSFAALRQPDSAAIVFKKLLAASGVEPDLAAAARTRLKALGVN